jgi:hypothetical protein
MSNASIERGQPSLEGGGFAQEPQVAASTAK